MEFPQHLEERGPIYLISPRCDYDAVVSPLSRLHPPPPASVRCVIPSLINCNATRIVRHPAASAPFSAAIHHSSRTPQPDGPFTWTPLDPGSPEPRTPQHQRPKPRTRTTVANRHPLSRFINCPPCFTVFRIGALSYCIEAEARGRQVSFPLERTAEYSGRHPLNGRVESQRTTKTSAEAKHEFHAAVRRRSSRLRFSRVSPGGAHTRSSH